MKSDAEGNIYQQIARDMVLDSLESKGYARLRVISDSMSPFIKIGDFVVVEKFSSQDYERGDIVVIDRKGEFITHRFIKSREDKFYTKGDRFHRLDEPVPADDLVGKVIEIEGRNYHFNLKSSKWKFINRIKGWLAISEVGLYSSVKGLQRKLLPKEQIGE
jgi:signal peptidase I